MTHKPFILLFTAFWIAMGSFAIPQSVQASTVAALSDEQLVDMSSCILHATIIRTEPVQFDSHIILTKVTVQVHENLKCDAAIENESFQFYVRGGSIGDFTQTVSGEFNAVPNDEIVADLNAIPSVVEWSMSLTGPNDWLEHYAIVDIPPVMQGSYYLMASTGPYFSSSDHISYQYMECNNIGLAHMIAEVGGAHCGQSRLHRRGD